MVGSDAANVQTRAVLSDDGSHYVLTGEKKFATNAALAGMMTVMARTPVSENGTTREKVTAFLVTPDLPGFEVVKNNRSKCGIRGSWQAVLRFNQMRVPADRILGQPGKGLKVALGVLNYGRCTLSAGCVGGAKLALEMAVERARTREQFGRPIGQFHLVKEMIARMAETTFAMDALTTSPRGWWTATPGTSCWRPHFQTVLLRGLWSVVDDAVQIWGGEGYMRETGLERMLPRRPHQPHRRRGHGSDDGVRRPGRHEGRRRRNSSRCCAPASTP